MIMYQGIFSFQLSYESYMNLYQTLSLSDLVESMKHRLLPGILTLLLLAVGISGCQQSPQSSSSSSASQKQQEQKDYAIAIHGGAGTISKDLPDSTKQAYRDALDKALSIGEKVLADGGSALEAVEQTIRQLENDPRFNAGKGAVYTSEGEHELDAAIMDGTTLEAGAITGIKTVKHPITLARHVMNNSRHILFAGDGAEAYAEQTDLERVDNSYFDTQHRYEDWQESKEEQSSMLNERDEKKAAKGKAANSENGNRDYIEDHVFGTVGCVALDQEGRLAAGTSTGGLTGKEYGRVGDVPIVGAGTYANSHVAVSATGIGEDIMRHVTGFHVGAVKEYKGTSLQKAADHVINNELNPGEAGLISVDSLGNIAMPYNTTGMFRGAADSEGKHMVKIWE